MDRYLGRVEKGSRIPVYVVTHAGDRTPVAPDDAPLVMVYSDSGVIGGRKIPVVPAGDGGGTGRFRGWLDLDSSYTAGRYTVQASWAVSGVRYASLSRFEVSGLGGTDGPGISAASVERAPHRYLVGQGSQGKVKSYKNPRA